MTKKNLQSYIWEIKIIDIVAFTPEYWKLSMGLKGEPIAMEKDKTTVIPMK